MNGFYDLPRGQQRPSPAWSDLLVETLTDLSLGGIDAQLNRRLANRDAINVLAFTPPAYVPTESFWHSTLIYQKRIDPLNGGSE